MNPVCQQCHYRFKSEEFGVPQELIVEIMLHMRYYKDDEGVLKWRFSEELRKHKKTLSETVEFLQTYRTHCPFYTSDADSLIKKRPLNENGNPPKALLLVIDPDKSQVDLLGRILSRHGYGVEKFTNEMEAMEHFDAHLEDIECVILEFYMPGGLKLIKHIETVKPHTNVITASGERLCSVEQGCDYCSDNLNRKRVMKPYRVNALLNVIDNFAEAECALKDKCVIPGKEDLNMMYS